VELVGAGHRAQGDNDVYLDDRQAQKQLPTPGMNTKVDEFAPCVIVLGGDE
jgi:hypothetical protein